METTAANVTEAEFHHKTAVQLFNLVWDLMEKDERTQQDIDTMIHAAHASRYHWGIVGEPVHFARGEWQISRVYSVLNKSEQAIYHAQRCLAWCEEHQLSPFDHAYAYEALARGHYVAGQKNEVNTYVELAKQHGEEVTDESSKQMLYDDLASLATQTVHKIQKITPNLWFDTQAEAAAKFYASIFTNSKIGRITHYPTGAVMTVEFQLEGQEFVALNGGPQYKFTEAISFIVHCESQEEVDYYWEKLSEDGDETAQVCGWLKDKYNVSWQIIPADLTEMVSEPDPEKSGRVMKALLQMKKKIDIKTLKQAYEG